MEVWITDFRNNTSAYFDQVFFQKEEIILTRRNHRVKIVNIDNDNWTKDFEVFTDEDDKNMDEAIKSEQVRSKLIKLSELISRKF